MGRCSRAVLRADLVRAAVPFAPPRFEMKQYSLSDFLDAAEVYFGWGTIRRYGLGAFQPFG
jgi:hypothetical protein